MDGAGVSAGKLTPVGSFSRPERSADAIEHSVRVHPSMMASGTEAKRYSPIECGAGSGQWPSAGSRSTCSRPTEARRSSSRADADADCCMSDWIAVNAQQERELIVQLRTMPGTCG